MEQSFIMDSKRRSDSFDVLRPRSRVPNIRDQNLPFREFDPDHAMNFENTSCSWCFVKWNWIKYEYLVIYFYFFAFFAGGGHGELMESKGKNMDL